MTVENGSALFLIWIAREVTWNAAARQITYTSSTNPNITPITLSEGDIITVGGSPAEGPTPTSIPWLATPNPACQGERWFVQSVTKP